MRQSARLLRALRWPPAGATPAEALSLMVSELADSASRPAALAPGASPDDTVVGETVAAAPPTGVALASWIPGTRGRQTVGTGREPVTATSNSCCGTMNRQRKACIGGG